MEYVGEETIIENEDGGDDGWVETHHYDATTSEIEDKVCDMTLGNKNDDEIAGDMEDEINRENADGGQDDEDDDEEAVDMEDFEESGMLHMVDPVWLSAFFLFVNEIEFVFLILRQQQSFSQLIKLNQKQQMMRLNPAIKWSIRGPMIYT